MLATATFTLGADTVGSVVLRPTKAGKRVLPSVSLRKAQLRVGTTMRTVRLRH